MGTLFRSPQCEFIEGDQNVFTTMQTWNGKRFDFRFSHSTIPCLGKTIISETVPFVQITTAAFIKMLGLKTLLFLLVPLSQQKD